MNQTAAHRVSAVIAHLDRKPTPTHVPQLESTAPKCPILVSHLNAMQAAGGIRRDIAFQLVMILDDVEGIAQLIDHEFPAERHAIARSQHIGESVKRLLSLIPDVA